jgi:hypothetical protein
MRAYASQKAPWRGKPRRRWSTGLDTHFLGTLFDWLINGSGTGDLNQDISLVSRLWAEEARHAKEHAKDDGEYDLPSQHLGYDLMIKSASLALSVPIGQARSIWEPILSQGPVAHYALRHFATNFFYQLSNGCDPARFEAVWREMVEYGLAARWEKLRKHWFYGQRLLCDLLGFGSESILTQLPDGALLKMRNVFERWAKEQLKRTEENLKRFCNFLASSFGAALRLDG